MINMKKLLSVVIAVLLLVATCLPFAALADDNKDSDVVFVIDVTESMKTNDPNQLTNLAIKKYVNKLNDAKSTGTNSIGVVTFAGDVINTMPLTKIDKNSAETINQFADDNVVQNARKTDASKGVKAAMDMLKDSKAGKKAIILVTDGEYSYADQSTNGQEPENAQALAEESTKLLADQVTAATANPDNGIKIYSIKIAKENVEVPDYLKVDFDSLANTGGTHAEPQNDEELDTAISTIQGQLVDMNIQHQEVPVKAQVPTDAEFIIPEGTIYAKIQVAHDPKSELQFVKITDNDGADVPFDTPDVVKDKDENSGKKILTSVTLESPKPGKLTVRIMSNQEQIVTIDCASASSFTIVAQQPQKELPAKSPLKLTAQVFQNMGDADKQISAEAAKSLVVFATIHKQGEEQAVADGEMKMDKKNNYTTGKMAVNEPGTYTIDYVVYDINNNQLASDSITINVGNPKPPILLICIIAGVVLLAAAAVVVILLMKKKKLPPKNLFGRFQYTYVNNLTGAYDSLQIWDLNGMPSGSSIANLIATFHPELSSTATIIFTTGGTAKAPELKVQNTGADLNATIAGIPISQPTKINQNDQLRIDAMDGSFYITATRIA